jgi:hypothetical protein
MEMVDSQEHLIKDMKSLFLWKLLLLLEVLEKLFTLYQLTDNEEVFCIFVHAEYFDYIGMILE